METYSAALWDVLYNRQESLKLRGMGDGYVVAERGDLIADTLKGVAKPSTIDNKATSDGVALGLIAIKMDIHKV